MQKITLNLVIYMQICGLIITICRIIYYIFIIIQGNIVKIYPLNWRFLPVLDPQVDILLVRDLDSDITEREVEAVKEFLKSDKVFSFFSFHTGSYIFTHIGISCYARPSSS